MLVCARIADGLLHDLRSPLMAIRGFAEVLDFRHAPELGADAQRCVANIVAAAQRLERMTEVLASWSRLGSGELELRPVDLRPLLEELVAEAGERAPELELEPGLPTVAADAGVLREVLAALLRDVRRVEGRREQGRVRIEIAGATSEPALARRALELHGGSLCSEPRGAQRLLVLELPAVPGV